MAVHHSNDLETVVFGVAFGTKVGNRRNRIDLRRCRLIGGSHEPNALRIITGVANNESTRLHGKAVVGMGNHLTERLGGHKQHSDDSSFAPVDANDRACQRQRLKSREPEPTHARIASDRAHYLRAVA